ncbi:hypothetical protein [Dongia rigui]|uniref:Uncharacterized protein n=1 Tax=Dongia rigui TaxID=940149 RepID=A0ABU5E440_9PROT|nr:hypothetical protein [Dongia rigui]MDY0874112.1 hypothetical protein [Dongia rigui]
MFRIMSIATLVLIALCFFIGASLAIADEGKTEISTGTAQEQTIDASRPVDEFYEPNLAKRDQDRYDFSEYLNGAATGPAVDAESVEEPEIKRDAPLEI